MSQSTRDPAAAVVHVLSREQSMLTQKSERDGHPMVGLAKLNVRLRELSQLCFIAAFVEKVRIGPKQHRKLCQS